MKPSLPHSDLNRSAPPPGTPFAAARSAFSGRKRTLLSSLGAMFAGLLLLLLSAPSASAQQQPPGCTGSGLGILLFTSAPDVHIGDTIFYSVTVFNGLGSGAIVCNADNITASVTTPDGVLHPLVLTNTALSHGQSDVYPNVVSYVVRAQDVRPDATVRTTASTQGIIRQNDTPSTGGGDQGVNTEVSLPCIQLAVQCVSSIGESGAITFSGTVTNCGNNTLVGVTITNMVDGRQFHVAFVTNLARGAFANFSGSWIPADPCNPSTATLVARGVDQFTAFPRAVTNAVSTTCTQTLTPGIVVTKVCPVAPVSPGQLITYSGTVSNTGNVTLNNVVVVNNQPAPNTTVFNLSSLAPGAVANFSGSYLAPTNCSVSDTLTARAGSRCGVDVVNTVSATCPITTTPRIAVTAECPTTPIVPGGTLTYRGTVRNTGDITLTGVVVKSSRPADNTTVFEIASLVPGASANFTGTYDVRVDACSVDTTFTATGRDLCTSATATHAVTTTCSIATAPSIAVTLVCPVAPGTPGAPITYTGTVRNSGNIFLTNVVVINSQAVPNTVLTVPALAPGATANFNVTFTTPADACSVSASVVARGNDACSGVLVTQSAAATCPLTTSPRLTITQTCPTVPAIPGGPLAYSGTVSNAGNITLTNVVVVNSRNGSNPIFTIPTLAPGASANFTGSYVVGADCSITSVSTAMARSVCGIDVTQAVSSTCPIVTTPGLVVTVLCPTTPILPGGTLSYAGTVRNNGDITLTDVVVKSGRPVADTTVFSIPSLAPGTSATFTGTYDVPDGACTVATTFIATGRDVCSATTVQNITVTTCTVTTAPAIAVTLACPVTPVATGSPITFTGTVRNSGNIILTNVVVINSQAVPNTVLTVATLAPGATADFTVTFTTPANACTVSASVVARGNDACTAVLVTKSAEATCTLVTAPRLAVTQNCPVTPASLGGTLTYSGSVSNAGNITLTNVVVLNDRSGSTPVFTVASLAPGMATNFTAGFTIPANSGCLITSTLTASGADSCNSQAVTATASSTCPVLTAPAIAVTQACPSTPAVQGGLLTYSGTVRNTGNVTLTNVVVVNNWPVPNVVVFTAASLAPGAVANFTGTYIVPENCCIAWSTVKATGQGCDGDMVADTDTGTCTVLTAPRLVVTKVCPPTVLHVGDMLYYSGTVSNAGNITLLNVTVLNSEPGGGSPIIGGFALAPGESVPYTASYLIPPDFCGTDTVTATSLDACTFDDVVASVTTTCPVTITSIPRITVTNHCPPQPTPHSSELIYTGTVHNAGEVTLVNVYVFINQPADNSPVVGPITLAPGASYDFTGRFMTPSFCCQIIDTITVHGQDRCTGSNVTATATAVCPLLNTPRIAVTRECPPGTVPVGSLYEFKGTVSNPGDTILTNVYVFSNHGNTPTPLLGPIELAPGEAQRYTGSYTVTAGSTPATDTVTARGMNTCAGVTVTAMANCLGAITAPDQILASITHANGVITVSWTASPGSTYRLQSSVNIQNPVWIDVPGDVTSSGATASKDLPMGANMQRFYRVMFVQ